jgi:hypothetical protein
MSHSHSGCHLKLAYDKKDTALVRHRRVIEAQQRCCVKRLLPICPAHGASKGLDSVTTAM